MICKILGIINVFENVLSMCLNIDFKVLIQMKVLITGA